MSALRPSAEGSNRGATKTGMLTKGILALLVAICEVRRGTMRNPGGGTVLWSGLVRPARLVVDNRSIQLFDKAAIGGRRYPKPGLERPAELAGIIEAAGQGDGGDFMPGLA